MITKKQIKIFIKYCDYEWRGITKRESETLTSEASKTLSQLANQIALVKTGHASKEFENKLQDMLNIEIEDKESIKLFVDSIS
jgi:hypothetical protein